jgi:hypothetical protein
MNHLLVILILTICTSSYGQRKDGVKRIIELNKGVDTIRIQEFDRNGNLTFWKYFPNSDGIAQILTYSYINNKVENYIWLHSNCGFIVSEYVYDSIANKMLTYEYEQKRNLKNGIDFINGIHSYSDLKNSKEYKKTVKNKNKHLKEVSTYQDSSLIKALVFDKNGDTISITNYQYFNGLVKLKIEISKPDNSTQSIFYEYDSLNNELGWTKIYNNDTSFVFKYKYSNKLLIERTEYSSTELSTIIKYDYWDSLLIKETMFDSEGNLMRTIDYSYNDEKNLIKMIDNYIYLNEFKEIDYKYEKY